MLRNLWMWAAGVFLCSGVASTADIVIDDFTSGPAVFSAGPSDPLQVEFPPPFVQDGLDPQRVLNGTRLVGIYGVQSGTGTITATIDPNRDGGRFDFDASQVSGAPEVQYGLIEAMFVGAGDPNVEEPVSTFSIDLTAGGNDHFEIEFLEASFPTPLYDEQPFSLLVYDAEFNRSGRRGLISLDFSLGSIQGPQTIVLPFSEAPRFNFRNVAYVELFTPNLADGATISLGEIRAAGGTSLVGDYDGDGLVGQADLNLVLLNWGSSTIPPQWVATDQFNGERVGQDELNGVLLNWGDESPAALAVPEPATAWVLAGGVAGLWGRRRRSATI
ncbi:MAG: PEP-CTERM sorting domain-containing protein [Planctomycetota bacterium]